MDQKKTLPLRTAYPFGRAHGLQTEVEEIQNMTIKAEFPQAVKRGYIIELFGKRGVFEEFKTRHWEYGKTPAGETKQRWYLRIKQQFLTGPAANGADDAESEGEESDQ